MLEPEARLRQLHKYIFQLSLFLLIFPTISSADNIIPKQVFLVFDEDKIIASNIEFNRFDEVRLSAKEEVLESSEGKAVIVIITTDRILAYSVHRASWEAKKTYAKEEVENISTEDYSALVVTSKRLLSFNGKTAQWVEKSRQKVFD